MKLITCIDSSGSIWPGVLTADAQAAMSLAHLSPDMLGLIEGGEDALAEMRKVFAAGRDTRPLDGLRVLAPIPVPVSIRDCAAYEKHMVNGRAARAKMTGTKPQKLADVWYQQPIYYKGNRMTVAGPNSVVEWPSYAKRLDFELELGAIIGRRVKNFARTESALDCIFGFTIFNDLTARDAQSREMPGGFGPAKGKDFDGGNILGPWLVTSDEVGDPYDLTLTARVNGETITIGHSGDMYHRWDAILAHASCGETLYPGELIGSGTVGGGCLMEHGRSLAPGDVIELEASGLGIQRTVIGSSPVVPAP